MEILPKALRRELGRAVLIIRVEMIISYRKALLIKSNYYNDIEAELQLFTFCLLS